MRNLPCLLLIGVQILAIGLSSGCRRPFQVVTDVCARVPDPVQVETTTPIRIQTEVTREAKEPLEEVVIRRSTSKGCQKIAIVDLDGLLVNQNLGSPLTIKENPVSLFREKLDHISSDPSFRAIVLRVNSPGGGVTASDIMRRDLQGFRDEHQIPIVACVMDVGAGGAYYVATAADEIFAHPTSIIGGIGVILNLYKLELETFNVISVSVKAGQNVDMGTPMRDMTDGARAILQNIADDFHHRFIEIVRASRSGIDDQEDMFDGRVCTAEVARTKNFIDEIGYIDDALQRAEGLGRCAGACVVLLDRKDDTAKTPLDVLSGAGQPLSFLPSIPGLDRSKLPTFLYIWQPDPALTSIIGG